MNELGSLFKDTIELALVSIDILKNKKGYHSYIKTHPGEVFDSSKVRKELLILFMKSIQNYLKMLQL